METEKAYPHFRGFFDDKWPLQSFHVVIIKGISFIKIPQADCRERGEMIGSPFECSLLIMELIIL